MKLSVVIPAYNEKNTIKEVVKKVAEVDLDKEIIVVDDGSGDGTTELLKEIKENNDQIKVHFQAENKGKGAAIRAGLNYVEGNIVIIQDADLELNPQEYPRLIEPILKGEAKVVYGSRFLNQKIDGLPLFSYLGNKAVTWATNILYGTSLTDQATGYKVFEASIIKSLPLKCKGFEFCSEVTAKVKKLGLDIIEIPVSYFPRNKKEGKKVRATDGLKALSTLLKYRF